MISSIAASIVLGVLFFAVALANLITAVSVLIVAGILAAAIAVCALVSALATGKV